MKTIYNLIASENLAQKFTPNLGLSAATEMLQAQAWRKNLGISTMHESLLKGLSAHQSPFSRNFSVGLADVLRSTSFNKSIVQGLGISQKVNFLNSTLHDSIFKGLTASSKGTLLQSLMMPNSAFDSIKAINSRYQELFTGLNGLALAMKSNSVVAQMNSLQGALGGMSGQLTGLASVNKQWDLLDDFEEITNEAVAINDRIVENEGITKESLVEIRDFLERIELRVDKIDNDASSILWKILAILSFILAVLGEVRNWTSQSNNEAKAPKIKYATKEEVEQTLKNQFSIFESKLKTQKEYRTTSRLCKVMLKPRNRTVVLAILPIGFDVIVLQVNHAWVYISYTNPKDNLPQTGWVMKKYLTSPK